MTFAHDYTEDRRDADEMIREFGQAGAIRKRTATGPEFNPTITWPEHAARIVVTTYSAREVDGTRIRADDLKVLVSAEGLTIEPTTADRLVLASGVGNPSSPFLSIVNVETLAPGGVVVLWTLHCRR